MSDQLETAMALLREIDNWLVCAPITTDADMAQSFVPMREKIAAFLSTSQQGGKTFWVIERHDLDGPKPLYYYLRPGMARYNGTGLEHDWTPDIHKAMKFDTRAAGEKERGGAVGCPVIEHAWIAAYAPSTLQHGGEPVAWRGYWLIERGSPAEWLCFKQHPFGYEPPSDANIVLTSDSHEALQFAREVDARNFMKFIYPRGLPVAPGLEYRVENHADEVASTSAADALPVVTAEQVDDALDAWFGQRGWRGDAVADGMVALDVLYRKDMRAALEAALRTQAGSKR